MWTRAEEAVDDSDGLGRHCEGGSLMLAVSIDQNLMSVCVSVFHLFSAVNVPSNQTEQLYQSCFDHSTHQEYHELMLKRESKTAVTRLENRNELDTCMNLRGPFCA